MVTESKSVNLRPTVVDHESLRDTFREDVLTGLSLARSKTPPKHLYDARGSELFEEICELDEYYPTRTERAIMSASSGEIAAALGSDVTLIEPGAGSGEKAGMLLKRLEQPRAVVPIEISLDALESASKRLANRFPDVTVHPVCADFQHTESIAERISEGRRVVFFPGSTIGNLDPEERSNLLSSFARAAGEGGGLLIGIDLKKDEDVLRAAYNDREGVTAAFNKNLLARINRELDGTFDTDGFEHDAPWVDERSRIEMHLVSRKDQVARVDGREFSFQAGERIHTESSHKFAPESFDDEAAAAGFDPIHHWQDERGWFQVSLYASR